MVAKDVRESTPPDAFVDESPKRTISVEAEVVKVIRLVATPGLRLAISTTF